MPHNSIKMAPRGEWAAIAFALLLPTLVTLAYFVWAASLAAAAQHAIYLLAKVVQFAFPVVWVCGVRRQRPQPWPLTMRGVALGIALGLLAIVATLALYHGWLKTTDLLSQATAQISRKATGVAIDHPWKLVALGVFYSLFHSLLEEYYWRWFVFGQLRTLLRFWPAAMISALGFMAHHVIVLATFFGLASPATWLFSLAVATGGVVWAWLYERSGSLLGPWLSHLLVDAGIFCVGYDILRQLSGG